MPRRWLRNWQLKAATLAAAVVGTFGFYGLIQANPLDAASAAPPANSAAPATSASLPDATQPSSANSPAPRTAATSTPTPRPTPVPLRRSRVSRGS